MTASEPVTADKPPASIRVLSIEHKGGNDYALWIDREGARHETLMARVKEHCRDGTKGLRPEDWPTFEDVAQGKVPPAIVPEAPVKLDPQVSMEQSLSINEFLKRSRVESAALAEAERAKEQAMERIFQENREWAIILTGLHHKVVGEESLLKALTLSGLSASLPEGRRFSTYTNASSQMGKSYSAEATAETLFPHLTIWQQSFSAKAFYYEAKENPYWMAGKVMVLDELADLAEDARNIIKPLISWTHGELHHLTVDEKKKPVDLVIKAAPVIWANSAMATEDSGLQLSNRFLKMGIDESRAQTDAINQTRCKNAQLGHFRPRDKVLEAQAVIREVLRFKPVDVLVPMAPCIRVEGEARNILDLFLSVVSACAYLHHPKRAKIESDDGPVLIASASDVLEGCELWNSFAAQRNAGLSGKYLKVIEAVEVWHRNNPSLTSIENPVHPTIEDITDQYNAIEGNGTISTKTVANTLTTLSERDLVNAKRPDGERFYIYELPRGREDVPQISVNLAGASALYDSWVGDMAEVGVTIEDETRDKVLDVPLDSPSREMTLSEIIHDLRDVGQDGFTRGQVEALRDDPDRGKNLFNELLERGTIVRKPHFKDRYTCPPAKTGRK